MSKPKDKLLWDRDLFYFAVNKVSGGRTDKIPRHYDEVYVGHTDTRSNGYDYPFIGLGVINLDQGAGYKGKLTIMDIDSKQWWQSDAADTLYPEGGGH